MSLGERVHSQMMNIRPNKSPTKLQAEYENSTQAYAYACGHRDARHACAEIALGTEVGRLSALCTEALHAKRAIEVELAHRDTVIRTLQAKLAVAQVKFYEDT